jgi:inner membrane protein
VANLRPARLAWAVEPEMPSIISHPAVPLAIALSLGRQVVSERLLLAGVAASVVPDLDVVAFRLGIPYADDLGHRGFTHSLLFAGFVALAAACAFRALHTTFTRAFWFVLVATASHGILDSFTNGGLGVTFFWAMVGREILCSDPSIEVSPLSIQRFISEGGAWVLLSELIWVWAPCALLAALLLTVRKT